jgi:hypothetical protein
VAVVVLTGIPCHSCSKRRFRRSCHCIIQNTIKDIPNTHKDASTVSSFFCCMVVDAVVVARIVVVVESEDGGVHCIINVAASNATHADGASKVLSCSYAKVVVFVDLLEEKEEAGWVMMLLLLLLFVWEKRELVPWLVGGFLQ